jgi:flagellar biosynthetic protein FliR
VPSLEPILPHVPGFLVVLARLTGLFVFSPIIASAMIPKRIKALLALGLALSVYPTIDQSAFANLEPNLFALAPLMAMELLIGVAVGVLMLTPLWGVQLAGTFMGQQMGLSLAPIFNPATDIESDSLGQLLFVMALSVFIMMGGVEAMWDCVVRSYALVGPGAFRADQRLLETFVGLLSAGFHLAMRVSMPVMAIVLVETVAVGFITKSLPTLNFMSVGFPIRIVLGLLALTAGLAGIHTAVRGDVRATIDIIGEWVDELGPAREHTAASTAVEAGAGVAHG